MQKGSTVPFGSRCPPLHLTDRGDDPICQMIARKVLEIDADGTGDPEEIAKLAAKQFGPS
jgi:hypothetical protein